MSDSNSNFSILSTVPKLDPDGTNWHLFKILFANFMDSHVLERLYKPESYPAETYKDVETRPSKKDGEDQSDFQKRMDVWEEGESRWKEEMKSCRKDNAKAIVALAKVCQSHSTLRLPTCYERLLALSNPCWTLPVGCSLVHRG